MKKLFFIGIVLAFAIWLGCSSSNEEAAPTGPTGPTTQRIAANTTAGAPSMTDANDATWNAVAATAIDISSTFSPKLPNPTAQAAPDSIYFKAIVASDTLYLRIEYFDDDLNLLREHLTLSNTSNMNFTRNTTAHEDQIFVMFAGLPNNTWDVWNWRSLTTASARLAEGKTFGPGDSIPVKDGIGGQVVELLNALDGGTIGHPNWVHSTGPAYTGEILYVDDTIDFAVFQSDPNWVQGDTLPGFIIDSFVYWKVQPDSAYASSRWDIFSIYDYNSTTDRLSVVLKCALNTGETDDLVMADSVKVKLGIFDDQSSFTTQGSRRGFSQEFWLIL